MLIKEANRGLHPDPKHAMTALHEVAGHLDIYVYVV